MNNPIGTILVVPKSTFKSGYINYPDNGMINASLYPELVQALGTAKLPSLGYSDSSPVGSLMFSMGEPSNPNWIEFNGRVGILSKYPKLKSVLSNMVSRIPDSEFKNIWIEAINLNSLPNFGNDIFLRQGLVNGLLYGDSVSVSGFTVLPAMVDQRNVLNPLGYSKVCDRETISPVGSNDVRESGIRTDLVLVAHKAEEYAVNAETVSVSFGEGRETAPKHLTAKLYIKADDANESFIPSTHKYIIKARNEA